MIDAVCKSCGKELKIDGLAIDAVTVEIKAAIQNLIRMAVCDACSKRLAGEKLKLREAEVQARRASTWGGICPPRYQDTDLGRLPRRFTAKVLEWQWGATGLCVHGPTGIGKTRSVFLLLHREHIAGRVVAAMTHQEFSETATRVAWAQGQKELKRWCDVLKNADILFLDDFGKSRLVGADGAGKQAEEFLFAICESRWTNNLPVLFTTNDTGASIQRRMSLERGPQFVRRMRDYSIMIQAK